MKTGRYSIRRGRLPVLSCIRLGWVCGAALVGLLPARQAAGQDVDYLRDIRPLLKHKCTSCHGGLKQKAGLRLDTAAFARAGGKHGPALVPGQPRNSVLMQKITATDPSERMPQEASPLTAGEIALLTRWITAGAPVPAEEQPEADPREHWSYQAPVRPAVPPIQGTAVENPIDAFLLERLARAGIVPQPLTDRATLLRRVTLDLIGLPPTPAELAAFRNDSSPLAYERVVDRLLQDPRHGERWGRHWMDVWRYSDWYGRRNVNEIRYGVRHIWRWRDWIVRSLNADKGYDRMILEMLAGDEIAPTDPGALAATGFVGRNWYKFDRDTWLFETVERTSQSLLGLTLRCARCHDHKYDPVSQEDYYRMRAFFEPHSVRTDALHYPAPTEKDNQKAPVLKDGLSRVFDEKAEAQTFLYRRGDSRQPDTAHPLTPAVPIALTREPVSIRKVALPIQAFYPALDTQMFQGRLAEARRKIEQVGEQIQAIQRERADLALKVGDPVSLVAEVRGLNLKVWLNGELRLDYALPIARQPGQFALWVHNGAAEFLDLVITPLAPNLESLRRQAKNLEVETRVAEKDRTIAEMELEALQARYAAETARYALPSATPETVSARSKEAVRLEKRLAFLQSERDLLAATEKERDKAEAALAQARASLEKEDGSYEPLGDIYPRTSTGRRLALAQWIASGKNPRTARVAVNHVWLRHFGTALVPSVANFGPSGQPPSHPELLDWLAMELVSHDWSLKHLHRLMVTSAAYRRTSHGPPDAADPENSLYWRMNPRRMEAEVIRDTLLHLTGHLDLSLGGPELDDQLAQTAPRRSLYFRVTPDDQAPMLALFDQANPDACYEREESIVPQQALALMNGGLALDQARRLARQISRVTGSGPENNRAFVLAACRHVLCRAPAGRETELLLEFLDQQNELLSDPQALHPFPQGGVSRIPPAPLPLQQARENLVHALFNHNDFVTIW